jgi:hypothetical protein
MGAMFVSAPFKLFADGFAVGFFAGDAVACVLGPPLAAPPPAIGPPVLETPAPGPKPIPLPVSGEDEELDGAATDRLALVDGAGALASVELGLLVAVAEAVIGGRLPPRVCEFSIPPGPEAVVEAVGLPVSVGVPLGCTWV